MAENILVDRLAALPSLENVPRNELEWLVEHGRFEVFEPGDVVAPKGRPVEYLFVVLSGYVTIHVDRGSGPRRVMEWGPGEATGMLPYSRMKAPPGDNYVEVKTEAIAIPRSMFPELISECPTFTAHTVHLMLDRARSFKASDLQNEKMVSLGKLAAGMAHELNNPASAILRSAKLLDESLEEADSASRALGAAGLSDDVFKSIFQFRKTCLLEPVDRVLSPIERAEREDEIVGWLERRDADPTLAMALADTSVTLDSMETLAAIVPTEALDAVIRWIAAGCTTHSLTGDVEEAAGRIYDLVAAIKRFTYMDQLAGAGSASVGDGLRDTVKILSSKAKAKGTAVSIRIEEDLPSVKASGAELNQVWMNLIDNALDAIQEGGTINIRADLEHDRVVVRVMDDGPGIPSDIVHRIFDPFFTTKPPGQGLGLGLETTRQIVHRYHGDITVESRPGRTEFRVSLVAQDAAPAGR